MKIAITVIVAVSIFVKMMGFPKLGRKSEIKLVLENNVEGCI